MTVFFIIKHISALKLKRIALKILGNSTQVRDYICASDQKEFCRRLCAKIKNLNLFI